MPPLCVTPPRSGIVKISLKSLDTGSFKYAELRRVEMDCPSGAPFHGYSTLDRHSIPCHSEPPPRRIPPPSFPLPEWRPLHNSALRSSRGFPEGRGLKVRNLIQRGVRMSRSAPPIIRLARLGRGRAEGAGEGSFGARFKIPLLLECVHGGYASKVLIQRALCARAIRFCPPPALPLPSPLRELPLCRQSPDSISPSRERRSESSYKIVNPLPW